MKRVSQSTEYSSGRGGPSNIKPLHHHEIFKMTQCMFVLFVGGKLKRYVPRTIRLVSGEKRDPGAEPAFDPLILSKANIAYFTYMQKHIIWFTII